MEMESLDINALADYYAYFPQPPYLMLVFGLVASVLSGLAFQAVLKELLVDWQAKKSTKTLNEMRGWRLLTPFLGMAGGSLCFLAAGVEVFGLPTRFAYGLSAFMTVFIARLVWWQLSKVLDMLEEGGSAALDLDSFY
jgi:hypothetical protein